MNTKIIFIILVIIIVLSVVTIGGVVLLKGNNGKNTNENFNSNTPVSDGGNSSTTQNVEKIEDLPKYNNYKLYAIKDAVNETWFSKIGEAEEIEHIDSHNKSFDWSDVILGYNQKTKKEYLYPDAIIIQGKNKDTKKYEQTVITKKQYATNDGYEFLKNILKISGSDDTEINDIITKNFKLTDEDINKHAESLSKFSESSAQKYKEEMSVGHADSIGKQIPWNFYKNLKDDAFNFKVEAWEVPNTMNDIVSYSFNIRGNCGDEFGDGNFRIILVYDDLKVNVNIPYSENDNVIYSTTFYYYSGILDEDAYEKYSESKQK